MDEDKVETVKDWRWEMKPRNCRLNNMFKVQQFLGFCNYYRQFIAKYSEKLVPLTWLTKKDEPCVWEEEQPLAFETMEQAFTTAPVLRHCDHERDVIIRTDASDYVSSGVLSRYDDDGIISPGPYFSKKHTTAKCNYDIYDQKVMAIIKAVEQWKTECEGASYLLQLLTDHLNLKYCMAKTHLNSQQARWSEFFLMFEYHIVYRPGKSNGNADALKRRPADPPEGGDERLETMQQVNLKLQSVPEHLPLWVDSPPAHGRPSISDFMTNAYETDPLPEKILKAIETKCGLQEITVAECIEEEGSIRYR